jgi:cation:H+ antiporter
MMEGWPIWASSAAFAAVAALITIVLTALFLAGMLERRDRTVLGMGWDSFAAIGTYVAGLFVLYQLK